MTKKKTGVKEIDWWQEQPATVAGVAAKGGIGSTFSGMSLLGIARGTKQSLAESKEEHEARVRRQRGGAVNYESLVKHEMNEHPQLTRKQAEKIVEDHLREENDSIVGTSKKLAEKYGSGKRMTTISVAARCETCKVTYPKGSKVTALDSGIGHLVLVCTECGGSLRTKT